MVHHCYSGHKPQELNALRLGKTYLHSWILRQWLLRTERSFEAQESELEELSFQHLQGLKNEN